MGLRATLGLLLVAAVTACDKGLEPEPICARGLVGICGTLHFRGTIPPNTDNVFIAAYATFPQNCNDLIANRQPFLPGSVPFTDSVTQYSVALLPGTYAWVLAVWKKVGTLTLSPADTALLRVAGYYRNRSDTTLAASVTVPGNGSAGDVDFIVDLDHLRPATDFVTCS